MVCTTDGDRALAQRLAGQLAREAWRRREEFIVELVPLERAVADALASGEPVGLIDDVTTPPEAGPATASPSCARC